jgi:hypothetical protein
MADRNSKPTARRFDRVILRALRTGNRATLRTIACLSHDTGLAAVQARSEAALRYLGGRAHV